MIRESENFVLIRSDKVRTSSGIRECFFDDVRKAGVKHTGSLSTRAAEIMRKVSAMLSALNYHRSQVTGNETWRASLGPSTEAVTDHQPSACAHRRKLWRPAELKADAVRDGLAPPALI